MEALVRFLFENSGIPVPEGALESRQDAQGESLTLKLTSEPLRHFLANDARRVRDFRAILSAAAAAMKTRVTLEIVEVA